MGAIRLTGRFFDAVGGVEGPEVPPHGRVGEGSRESSMSGATRAPQRERASRSRGADNAPLPVMLLAPGPIPRFESRPS